MTLRDPFAAYNAKSNLEAHLICGLLNDAGVPAVTIEDISQVGVWVGGLVSEIHKPQVWIERTDVERARPILTAYERRNAERGAERPLEPPVSAVCEECGTRTEFPAHLKGTTQSCPNCKAYMDVGDDEAGDWGEAEDEA
jgi:hypothetical protein